MGICCCCCNKEENLQKLRRDSSLSNISTKRFDVAETNAPDYNMEDFPFLDMNPVLLESSSNVPTNRYSSERTTSILSLTQGRLSFLSSTSK
jgi:hypothetical protein